MRETNDDQVVVSLMWPQQCDICGPHYWLRFAVVSIEPVFYEDGEFAGLDSAVYFKKCGHRVPQLHPDPILVARRLDAVREIE